jgi:hypothetical protein
VALLGAAHEAARECRARLRLVFFNRQFRSVGVG